MADALSRPSLAHLQLSPGIELAEMAAEKRHLGSSCDEDVSGLHLQELPLTTGNGTILCDVSTPSHRPFLPPSLRRKVFASLYNLSHPGSRATDKPVSDRFVWPGMHKDLKAWARACIACQRSKVQRQNKTPIGSFPGPGARSSHVHLDIVGALPLSTGCSYLLTCVYRFTRWPETVLLTRDEVALLQAPVATHGLSRMSAHAHQGCLALALLGLGFCETFAVRSGSAPVLRRSPFKTLDRHKRRKRF
nr:unnamed protein product [Spirometra erinaceieuropaei]